MTSYQGICHCGTVKFSFTLPTPITEMEVVRCNCSICTQNGYLMVYPKPSEISFDHPEDAVTAYRFASKKFPHYFCATCGSSLYARGPEETGLVAVNVRAVEGVDLETLKLKAMDGRSM
ncbi:Mss4-like protein [Aspergillus cavernicola]|uniref:Mss4-like protein n=1 Tax=Aspergillus cavernicola TaxID=176166 RepID=A0ABR4IXZ0_9EURO